MNPLRFLLEPFAVLFGIIVRCRNFLYDKAFFPIYEAPIPILSVGNISVGGTGKTPTAEYILGYYQAKGIRVAYLSRGYGRRSKGYQKVKPQQGGASHFGDEALQVAQKFPMLPVAVCEERKEGIQRLVDEEQVELIVLDDAFQHRKVSRDVDMVLVDANRMPTSDRLLPAGRLREPLGGLKRSNMVIVNKLTDLAAIPTIERQLSPYQKNLAFAQPKLGSIVPFFENGNSVPSLDQIAVLLFSGIGNNAFFRYQVEKEGTEVISSHFFRDHRTYTQEDLEKIVHSYNKISQKSPNLKPVWILTTEKDYFRLRDESWLLNFQELPLGYLPIELSWLKGEENVHTLLDSLFRQ